jgi:hypothetical protein
MILDVMSNQLWSYILYVRCREPDIRTPSNAAVRAKLTIVLACSKAWLPRSGNVGS